MEGEELATYAALRDAGAHGTLHGVIAEDNNPVGKVDLEGGGFEGEDTGQGLTADLMAHVLGVGKGADDHFAVNVGPPAQHHTPAVE